ncbi:hypothetical protein [Paraburkholderia caffeinilytica]|uniref:hypothetical protein n=1 Tax=Paraburkholderia caffeinilytica TaxID=1761016 RepID=UPI003DA1BA3B
MISFPTRVHADQFETWLLYGTSEFRAKDGRMLAFASEQERRRVELDNQVFLRSFNPVWNNPDLPGHTTERESLVRFLFDHCLAHRSYFQQWPDFVTILKREVTEGRVIAVRERRLLPYRAHADA